MPSSTTKNGVDCVWSYLLFCKLLPLWLRKLRRRRNPRCRDRRRRDSEPPPWLSQQFCWGRRDWGGGPSWKRTTADLAQAILGRGGVVTILRLSIVKGIYFRLEIYQALLRWIALFHVFSQSLKWNCGNSHSTVKNCAKTHVFIKKKFPRITHSYKSFQNYKK